MEFFAASYLKRYFVASYPKWYFVASYPKGNIDWKPHWARVNRGLLALSLPGSTPPHSACQEALFQCHTFQKIYDLASINWLNIEMPCKCGTHCGQTGKVGRRHLWFSCCIQSSWQRNRGHWLDQPFLRTRAGLILVGEQNCPAQCIQQSLSRKSKVKQPLSESSPPHDWTDRSESENCKIWKCCPMSLFFEVTSLKNCGNFRKSCVLPRESLEGNDDEADRAVWAS